MRPGRKMNYNTSVQSDKVSFVFMLSAQAITFD